MHHNQSGTTNHEINLHQIYSNHWSSELQSAQSQFIIPFIQPDNKPVDSLQSQLTIPPIPLEHLVKSPSRSSVYLGEQFKVYLTLTLNSEPTTHPEVNDHDILAHLHGSLSIRAEFNLIQKNYPSHETQTNSKTSSSAFAPRSKKFHPSGNFHSSIPIPHGSSLSRQHPSHPTDPSQLSSDPYTLYQNFNHGQNHDASSPNHLDQHSEHSSSSHDPSMPLHLVKLSVEKLGDQWLIVWELENNITPPGNLTNLKYLKLSSVITYNPTCSPYSKPRPSHLSANFLSDSPPLIHFQPSSGGTNEGFKRMLENDLIDGTCQDPPISAEPATIKSINSTPANQNEINYSNSQPNHLPEPNRFLNPLLKQRTSHPSTKASRSEELLPRLPAESSHGISALLMLSGKRSSSATIGHQGIPSSSFNSTQSFNSGHSSSPPKFTERQLLLVVPIVDPIKLEIETKLPCNQLMKYHDLMLEEPNLSGTCFVEKKNNFNPLLMLDICFPTSSDDDDEDHFLLEAVDIKLEQYGLRSEFNNFHTAAVNIIPVIPRQPDPNFPCEFYHDDRHQLIYSIQTRRVDLLTENANYPSPSITKHSHYPVYSVLTPSTSISNANCALQHQKRGVSTFPDAEEFMQNQNASSGTTVNQVSGQARPSPYKAQHQPSSDESMEFKSGFHLKNQQGTGPIFLLSVMIRGRVVSEKKDLGTQSSGVISGTWTSLLSSKELSNPTSLQLNRNQGCFEKTDLESDAPPLTSTTTGTGKMISSGAAFDDKLNYNKKTFLQGLVAGSTQHTASNVMTALKDFSNFQSYYLQMSKLGEEGNQKNNWLPPFDLPAINPTLDQHDPRSRHKYLHPIDNFSSLISPTLVSPLGPNRNLGRQLVSSNSRYLLDPSDTRSISTPKFSDRFSQTKIEVPRNQAKNNLSLRMREQKIDSPIQNTFASLKGEEMMMVEVKLLNSHRFNPKDEKQAKLNNNRFKLYEPFCVEISILHRASHPDHHNRHHDPSSFEDDFQLGPFKIKIITDLINDLPSSLIKSSTDNSHTIPGKLNKSNYNHISYSHHQPDSVYRDVGVISLNDSIQIGPLEIGQCETGKMDLVGIKPGFFQLKAIQIIPLRPHASALSSNHVDFFLLDPVVVFIE